MSTLKIIPDDSRTIRPLPLDQINFDVVLESVPVVINGGGVTEVTERDLVYEEATGATVRNDGQIHATQEGEDNFDVVSFESLDESLATVDENGYVTASEENEGLVGILVKTQHLKKRVDHNAFVQTSATVSVFKEFAAGSLGRHICDAVDAKALAGGGMALYSTRDHTTPTYIRNTSNWTDSVDWTGVAVWNSQTNSSRRGLTMISPIHWVGAAHYRVANGSTVRFVTADNQVITRTVVDSKAIVAGGSTNTDTQVGILNEPVPSSIKHYKVLPANFKNWLVGRESLGNSMLGRQPLLTTNQLQESVLRHTLNMFSLTVSHAQGKLPETPDIRTPYTKTLITGDSGQPAFYLINGEMVVLGCHFSAVSFWFLSGYIDEINQAMEDLAGAPTYSLETVDLSGFTDFS